MYQIRLCPFYVDGVQNLSFLPFSEQNRIKIAVSRRYSSYLPGRKYKFRVYTDMNNKMVLTFTPMLLAALCNFRGLIL